MMPNPRLPAEILDYIVGNLHDTEDAFRSCCLVSKSWIPRARKHLFANIAFPTVESLQSWKKKFPDPSTSPARYAKSLFIDCAAPNAEAGSWIRGFSRIVRLEVGTYLNLDEPVISLIPFHGLSPVLKSLHVTAPALPPSCIFDLVLSFPLLEDLAVTTHGMWARHSGNSKEDERPTNPQPSSPPVLTGSLKLDLFGGMKPITSRLLSVPGGIRFWELTLTWLHEKDLLTTTRLAEECSHTLESLDITWSLGEPGSASVDLSKATKLKDVVFRLDWWGIQWVIMALQTITPKHQDLRQIMIWLSYYLTLCGVGTEVRWTVGVAKYGQWLDLDRLLV